MSNKKFFFLGFVWCLSLGIFTPVAQATLETLYLIVFTDNGSPYDKLAMAVDVDVPDGGGLSQVDFTFYNNSTVISTITGIYFDSDGGTLLDIADISSSQGVSFTENKVSPPVLPGGNMIGFDATVGFLADSDNPGPQNGVNSLQDPKEWVTITFNLQSGFDFSSVIDDLDNNALNIGVHLTNIEGGYSESFYIPEPTTIALLGLGTLVLLRKRTAFISP